MLKFSFRWPELVLAAAAFLVNASWAQEITAQAIDADMKVLTDKFMRERPE